MPLYTTAILGVSIEIFCTVLSSTSSEGSFFSVAITTPSLALMPREVAPAWTAFRAYSICTSFPLGEKVVKEKLQYCRGGRRASDQIVAVLPCQHLLLPDCQAGWLCESTCTGSLPWLLLQLLLRFAVFRGGGGVLGTQPCLHYALQNTLAHLCPNHVICSSTEVKNINPITCSLLTTKGKRKRTWTCRYCVGPPHPWCVNLWYEQECWTGIVAPQLHRARSLLRERLEKPVNPPACTLPTLPPRPPGQALRVNTAFLSSLGAQNDIALPWPGACWWSSSTHASSTATSATWNHYSSPHVLSRPQRPCRRVCVAASQRGGNSSSNRSLQVQQRAPNRDVSDNDAAVLKSMVASQFQYQVRKNRKNAEPKNPVSDFVHKLNVAWRIFFPEQPKVCVCGCACVYWAECAQRC
eukprot:scaffold37132_cov23-Tisochrysis_lutea.AAC.3